LRRRISELENSDEDDEEEEDEGVARKITSSVSRKKKKKRLDSLTPPSSDHLDDEADGDDESDKNDDETEISARQPIRLTIRNSSCTIGDGNSPTRTTSAAAAMFLRVKNGDRRRVSTTNNRKRTIDEDVASEFTTSSTTSDYDEDDRSSVDGVRSRKRRARVKRAKSNVVARSSDTVEPPELQVMVSDSELWFINERNSKHKQETTTACQSGSTVAEHREDGKEITTNHATNGGCLDSFGDAAALDDDNDSDSRLNVVVTDVKAHDYSVIIKECYQPFGFFKNSS